MNTYLAISYALSCLAIVISLIVALMRVDK